ncbi:MAG: DUF559 domain-containing protein [Prevotella sp.]|jgi:very-short-patch-repair endonuclease|nr:DUF559 domain-containing protein [Prevotella sp.]
MYVYETGNENYDLLKEFAEHNRKYPTEAESILWSLLRNKNLGDKFRRQHIIGNYIADFVCLHNKLIIEIDGGYHFAGNQIVKDKERTEGLEELGFRIVRFTNDEVLFDTNRVINEIHEAMNTPSQTPTTQSPSPFGEGRGGASGAWAVDAACSGNPGPMEYQAIDLQTGARVFHFGPMHGTNNIGEFLAIVHALALMEKQGIRDHVIYSDSRNAIIWVQKMQCKTKLERTPQTEQLYQIIYRAEMWLRTHPFRVPILKWDTQNWGEIPADFGRK